MIVKILFCQKKNPWIYFLINSLELYLAIFYIPVKIYLYICLFIYEQLQIPFCCILYCYIGADPSAVRNPGIGSGYGRRIVAYQSSSHNDNPLVMETFDAAVAAEPDANPLFHSDRGFQHTSREFHQRLVSPQMTQRLSRVLHCVDNAPMEGFWGILK